MSDKGLINESLFKWTLVEYIRCIDLDYGTNKSMLTIPVTSVEL